MKRSIKAVIIVSVLLNILMAAIIAGHMGRCFLESDHDHNFQEIAAALPADKRAGFMEAVNHAKDENGELHEQLSDARKQAANILKTNPFDKRAYLSQLQKINNLRGRIMLHMGETIANIAEKLTQEERAVLADAILKLNHHGSS